ncbi:hypothetical protein ACWGJT_13870 [Streptomyces xantholiticus]
MLRRRPPLLAPPELNDRPLRRTLDELRSPHQLHGLGADRTRASWKAVAELLHATGQDWDRRVHRISVLAHALPANVSVRWIADRPEDRDALTVRAYVQAARAVTEGRAVAERAGDACLRAAAAYPEDPTPWLALMLLMHSFAAPTSDTVPVWTEAVTRDPWNRTAYHQILRYLSPRGHGTVPDLIDFSRQVAIQAPHGSPLALLPLAARTELVAHRRRGGSTDALLADRQWNGPEATREIDTALAKWFHASGPPHAEALADLNLLAFALTRTRRGADAAPVFRRIGRQMTPHPWELLPNPAETFVYWRDQNRA